MTLFASLAWRRRQSRERSSTISPVPPAISTAASGDTASEFECCLLTTETMKNSLLKPEPPLTPEGLRPRKAYSIIREELHLPSQVLEDFPFQEYAPSALLPPVRNAVSSPQVSRSFSSLPSANNASAISPQVTNSSFYSRSSHQSSMVAESPNLGDAKTAVGALVGIKVGMNAASTTRTGILPPLPDSSSGETLGVLPPRSWKIDRDNQDMMFETLHDEMDKDEDDETEEEDGFPQPYQKLDDSNEIMLRSSSPVSTDASSIRGGSEASWRQYDWQQSQNRAKAQPVDSRNTSFNSQHALVQETQDNYVYNFDPISVEPEEQHYVVSADDHMTHISAISHPTVQNDSIHSLDSVQDSHVTESPQQEYDFYSEDLMENALLNRKVVKQRRSKEHMVLGVIQRMQHNLNLIEEIEGMQREEGHESFVRTSTDQDGLLMGYSSEKRLKLSKYLDSILYEMDVARPEEFFLSPSQVDRMADTHNDLRDALSFVRTLVQSAIPQNEHQLLPQWTFKSTIRSSMTVPSIPESPETVRGGDTSVFSLPSEASTTPHTSNVSMTTTITSRPTPLRAQPSSPHRPTHEASLIRHTLEIALTLVQKMTLACNKLLADKCTHEDSIFATEAIKRNYLQLLALKRGDLHVVMDAFVVAGKEEEENNEMGDGLSRKVSEDEEQQPLRLITNLPGKSNKNMHAPFVNEEEEVHSSSHDMFSPTTADMQSGCNRIEDDAEEGNRARLHINCQATPVVMPADLSPTSSDSGFDYDKVEMTDTGNEDDELRHQVTAMSTKPAEPSPESSPENSNMFSPDCGQMLAGLSQMGSYDYMCENTFYSRRTKNS